jgi:hypothetical protein
MECGWKPEGSIYRDTEHQSVSCSTWYTLQYRTAACRSSPQVYLAPANKGLGRAESPCCSPIGHCDSLQGRHLSWRGAICSMQSTLSPRNMQSASNADFRTVSPSATVATHPSTAPSPKTLRYTAGSGPLMVRQSLRLNPQLRSWLRMLRV